MLGTLSTYKNLRRKAKKSVAKPNSPGPKWLCARGQYFSLSTHTIRDMLFYCSKEKIDLIMLALDYTKAFDSVNFDFIHTAFELYNFGNNFKQWIKVIYNGGKSCFSNNGFISKTFEIERSTRQVDPISHLVFILVLEILFIHLRSDPNIKGIKIVKNEVKLTSYADDASYFMKDKISAETLLLAIEKFSKVSGLEVNRTKSECLLFDFELNLSPHDKFCGIPVVDNIKILGHLFGKNKTICDFQNLYSKINKLEKIENIWKQRTLTLMGKNLLINSLLNSLFIFNAQIEIPPTDFTKIVEAKNKEFLWGGGTAKIAHHSIIGDYQEGGLKYKDLNSFVLSVNYKFISRLTNTVNLNSTCLPRFWLMKLFNIPTECNNDDQQYFYDFFCNQLNILDCKIQVPRKALWKGHPFYYEILQSYGKCLEDFPKSKHYILSVPLWYNKFLGTKFNIKLSKAGYNYLRDFYMEGNLLTPVQLNRNLAPTVFRALVNLMNKIPLSISNAISSSQRKSLVIFPLQTIHFKGVDYKLSHMDAKAIYSKLIYPKVKMPKGLLNWCMDLELSDSQIKTSLSFSCDEQLKE